MSDLPVEIPPMDEYNRTLISQVHPQDWTHPKPAECYNLVVLGAGTAGLVAAAGAAGLGAKVALVEKRLLGGDCLNVGCVPSKTLIRSSRAAAEVRAARGYGISASEPEVDFARVMERVRRVRAGISPHDSVRRFRDLGVDVFLGEARFAGSGQVEVAGEKLRFKKAVIATGARAARPSIPGLEEAGTLTNETVFSLTGLPRRLAVIGGGPIGCELAQAFRRLGAEVTLLHSHGHLLEREDGDAAEIVQKVFLREGIRFVLNARILKAERHGEEKILHYQSEDGAGQAVVDAILVGAGRAPNVEGLNLESLGVRYDLKKGVGVDDFLRTTHPNVYAAGDVCLPWKFTHAADASARIVIQNALFKGRKRLSSLIVPWCTYTDPEVAHVGLSEREARERGIPFDTFLRPWAEVDRAVTDGEEEGFAKALVRKGSDKILGATIVARHAGDMIGEIVLAMTAGAGLKTLSGVIHPYPTQAEALKQLGDAYNRKRLTPFVKKLFSRWLAWTR